MKPRLSQLYLLHVLNDGVRTALVVLLPFIAKDLSLSLTQVGFLGSSQGLLMMLLGIPAGLLAARMGGLRLLSYALILYSISVIAIAFSTSITLVVVAFFAAAVGFGVFHPVGFASIAKYAPKDQVGISMGKFSSLGEIGRMGIPPTAILATSYFGWRPTLIVMGAIGCLLYLYSKYISKIPKEHSSQNLEHHTDWLKMLVYLAKQPKILFSSFSNMIDASASNIVTIFYPFVILAKGVTPFMLGIMTGVYFIGGLCGKIVLGHRADKMKTSTLFIIAELMMAILLLFLAFFTNLYLLFILSFCLGIFTKGTSSVVQTLISESAQGAHFEKVFSISETLSGIAAATAPLIAGVIADSFGVLSTLYLAAVVALLAIVPAYLSQSVQRKPSLT